LIGRDIATPQTAKVDFKKYSEKPFPEKRQGTFLFDFQEPALAAWS
jgi:hypothetical protein